MLISEPPENGIFYKGSQIYACVSWWHHLHQGLIEGEGKLLAVARDLTSCLVDLASWSLDIWVNTVICEFAQRKTMGILGLVCSRLQVSVVFHLFRDLHTF
jgi:hypothetical protein